MRPHIKTAEVRHDDDEVTFAVTFKWGRPWAMDHCEVGVIAGEIRRALAAHFAEYPQLHSLVAVETWEPREERHIGKRGVPVELGGAIEARKERDRQAACCSECAHVSHGACLYCSMSDVECVARLAAVQ